MASRKKKSIKLLLIAVILLAFITALPMAYLMLFYSSNYQIQLNGPEEMTLNLNGIYEEQGATAKVSGRDATDDIKVTGEVDTQTPGTYEIRYDVGRIYKIRTVTVTDKMDPVIELKGEHEIATKLGEPWEDPGFDAKDDDGTDLTSKVKVDTSALNKAGKGQVTYTVADPSGNTTRISREVKVEANTDYETPGLPICMYHYVYDENDPPEDLHKRYGNYVSAQALEEELNWLNSEGYYYPTWDEVRAYVDGELLLPEKSVVITFDDGEMSFLLNGIPVLEKCHVPATSFLITKNKGAEKAARFASEYVTYQSHSHNMHRTGGSIGHGGIFTALPKEEAVADLQQSIELCGGNKDAFAYPYGDYNEATHVALEEIGFKCAVTTQPGKARPGDDPLLLPRQRMVLDQSLQSFQNKVRPPQSATSGAGTQTE